MADMDEEKKYEDVIKTLKGLQRVKAPANFEPDLKRKINSEKYAEEKKQSFWQNILLPSRLIPSLGLVAAAVIVFMVVNINSEEMEDPLLMEPRMRKDIFEITNYESIKNKEEEVIKDKSVTVQEPTLENKKHESLTKSSDDKNLAGRQKENKNDGEGIILEQQPVTEEQPSFTDNVLAETSFADVSNEFDEDIVRTEKATGLAITKDELNFRQIQLSKEEQEVVNELKKKVQSVNRKEVDIK